MDNGAILHIYLVSDTNRVYITAKNSIKPNAAIVAHNDIAAKRSIWGNKTVLSP
jgi:hypothetical protein